MEVTVLQAHNTPAKPILSIHAGSVRRQAKLELNQPFVIPHPGTDDGTVEVSLFQQLASHVLPDDGKPEVVCSIPLRKPDGTASQVKLRVKRSGEGRCELPSMSESLKAPPIQEGATKDYFDNHNLLNRIHNLMKDVLRDQPDNPYRFMLEKLKQTQKAAADESIHEDIKSKDTGFGPPEPFSAADDGTGVAPELPAVVPRPPEQPPPGNSPRKGRMMKSKPNVQSIAHATLCCVFRMRHCVKAAEDSVREEECTKKSRELTCSILRSARETLASKATSVRGQARTCLNIVLRNSSYLQSSEYKVKLTKWTVHHAYRGATYR